jgi:uncharacterized protein (DUF486 family)
MISAATPQLSALLTLYTKILPVSTFPWIPLCVAAAFQVFAWFGGRFLGDLTLIPRILVLWLFAFGEYSVMSPAMNASVELLNMTEPLLVVIYQVLTLVVFTIINTFIFKNPFKVKYIVSYILLSLAVYVAYMW